MRPLRTAHVGLAGAVVLNESHQTAPNDRPPELHLHPEWQAGAPAGIRAIAPAVPLIAATHSDTVWDAPPAMRASA